MATGNHCPAAEASFWDGSHLAQQSHCTGPNWDSRHEYAPTRGPPQQAGSLGGLWGGHLVHSSPHLAAERASGTENICTYVSPPPWLGAPHAEDCWARQRSAVSRAQGMDQANLSSNPAGLLLEGERWH